MALIVTPITFMNSLLYRIQRCRYGRELDAISIDHPPIFVIGHWRSGTTMLHEMMVLDDRFAFPTTYECFSANHFLLTRRFLPQLVSFLLPRRRPMDNMAVSFDHPQEDEFALLSMGAPSPILKMAFPNDDPPYLEFLDMIDVRDADLRVWKAKLVEFAKALTFLKGKQLVLKSPPHTGRLEVLSSLFPGARFVHIVRDPMTLFPSNRRLWMALDDAQGFQLPRHQHLDDFVFTAFERMYRGFEDQRGKIPAEHLCETRYEDLVADPLAELQRIYDELGLGNFEQVRPQIEEYVAQRKDYKANRHELELEVESEIRTRWSGYMQRYGYGHESPDLAQKCGNAEGGEMTDF
jgi:hypothetical protein